MAKKLSKRKMVEKIMKAKEEELDRPYPDDWFLSGDILCIATLDPAKEYRAPMLILQFADEFIEENKWRLP